MTLKDAHLLYNGLYLVYWHEGGRSVAAVGRLSDGTPWLAPANWIRVPQTVEACEKAWAAVEGVEQLAGSV